MLQVSWPVLLAAIGLTVAAYGIFFVQCYLLALALNLSLNFTTVVYAVALGSLVTLLPLSISGLGTREATIVYYLGLQGISSSAALGFSLTLFIVFYVGGSLFGMIAWWLEPIPMDGLSRRLVSRSAIENYGDG